jgi:hypothetical protein
MDTNEAARSFLDQWRAQWPEWTLAEVFVPAAQREVAVAWFALLKIFADAAWGGSDPTPGLAKLAWWQEELRGWAKGARRHPLGATLQPHAAPWTALADAMGALRHRELPADPAAAMLALRGLADAVSRVEAALFGGTPGITATPLAMLAPAAVGQGGAVAARSLHDSSGSLQSGPRPARLLGVLVTLRLRAACADGEWRPAPRWRSLWALWRVARN